MEGARREDFKLRAEMDAKVFEEQRSPKIMGTCGGYTQDLREQCPQGWTKHGENMCTAPVSYSGPCAPVAFTGALASEGKVSFASRCALCWPCAREGSHNREKWNQNGPIDEVTGKVVLAMRP